MSSGIYSALSGAVAQEKNLAVLANNVANVSTHGYKADRVAFNEALAKQAQGQPQRNISLHYAAVNRVQVDESQGALEQTGRSLDFAILGDGLFTVRTQQGDRYTRAGSFLTDAQGVVRNQLGDALLVEGERDKPEGRELTIPPGSHDITVGEDGSISADGQNLGKLRLRSFQRPEDLQKAGATYFAPAQGVTPQQPAFVQITQGALETANLNAVQGLNELITVSRSFDALQKVIQTFRAVDERTAREMAGR